MKINWKVLLALGLVAWVIVSSQTTLITIVVVSGALIYISYATKHGWTGRLRRLGKPILETQPVVVIGGTDSEGRALRSHNYHTD